MPSLYTSRQKFNGDAIAIFENIKQRPHAFFLDSSMGGDQSRYSYLGFDPVEKVQGNDISLLKKKWSKYRLPSGRGLPAGAVGYIGYDNQLWFGLYDGIITIDHAKGQLILTALSQNRLNILKEAIHVKPQASAKQQFKGKISFKGNFTKAQYTAAVRRCLMHIGKGDIYQINLSQRIDLVLKSWQRYVDSAAIYGQLRQQSPSSFGAYLDDGKQFILSASPERFVRLTGRNVEVRPMKGTRPRGKNDVQDARLKKELFQSSKEIAELLMVTDLERNDLGRVCDYGSVKVAAMRTIEEYATVFQATSTVTGRLHKKFDQFDLLRALFPSGSVTGCPKIAAMKIIKQLEKCPRGLYTGALGYISFAGDMEFNVLIRTLFLGKGRISFHVGGGIVADSQPQAEWEETWVKARAMTQAIQAAFKVDQQELGN